jgi:AbrB family looped-hinge helix DNA binding protein
MKDSGTLTITSKGQTTIPASLRHKLGIPKAGGTLKISFDEGTGELTVSRPTTIAELSRRVSRHIKPGTSPIEDVDAYYQANRQSGSSGKSNQSSQL